MFLPEMTTKKSKIFFSSLLLYQVAGSDFSHYLDFYPSTFVLIFLLLSIVYLFFAVFCHVFPNFLPNRLIKFYMTIRLFFVFLLLFYFASF